MKKSVRPALMAGNWKMNMVPSAVRGFADSLRDQLPGVGAGVEVALCVSFPLLPAMKGATIGTTVKTGAQDVSVHASGAYTGEVSAAQLNDLDVDCCIIGHSERRAYHAESDETVNAKLRVLLDAGIMPIVCVGESLEQRDAGVTIDFVSGQVRAALQGVSADEIAKVVIAYEPIWAIGTGRTATAGQAQEVCGAIRGVLNSLYGDVSDKVRVLYGGSMNGKNVAELLAQPDIDGGLIGGASLKPAEFGSMIGAAVNG